LLAFGEVSGFHMVQVRWGPAKGQSLFFRFISSPLAPVSTPTVEPVASVCHTRWRPWGINIYPLLVFFLPSVSPCSDVKGVP
jgi:hypothetical protein